MKGNPLIDVGDMLRSFCKTSEGVFVQSHFDVAVRSYEAEFPIENLRSEALKALKLITLELSARFYIDAVENRYFDFDRSKFRTRIESNIAAASKYLDYFKSMPTNPDQ
jgi:hypothetical protein